MVFHLQVGISFYNFASESKGQAQFLACVNMKVEHKKLEYYETF